MHLPDGSGCAGAKKGVRKRMGDKRYLKWYNKIGYGSGDLAANCIYGLLTSFVLIYLTDTVGLNAGIVGTLIMFSKFADGIKKTIQWYLDHKDWWETILSGEYQDYYERMYGDR